MDLRSQTNKCMKPSVHYLEFGAAATPSSDVFGVLWQLDVSKPPAGDSDNRQWGGIAEGDLVVFPSLLTGAGEFEAVRVIGSPNEQLLPVLPLGVEYPEFPAVIVQLAESKDLSLRQLYEAPFDAILQDDSPKMKLLDVIGGDAAMLKDMWENPPIQRRRKAYGDPWLIKLGDCTWIKTIDGKALDGDEL